MEFKNGTSVYTSDGKDAGHIRRVVIEPDTNEATHIVVQSGLIGKDDRVIPMAYVESADSEKITLTCPIEEVKGMSPLKIKQEIPMSEGAGRGQGYDPMSGSAGWNATITETKRTIPEELVALKEGAQVVSEDNEHLGNIESVYTANDSHNVTHFMVSQGLLVKTRKSVPVQWVTSLDEKKVRVDIAASEFEDVLPEQEH